MLSWAITFLIIALIAAVLGFGGLAGTAVGIAKILFFVFLDDQQFFSAFAASAIFSVAAARSDLFYERAELRLSPNAKTSADSRTFGQVHVFDELNGRS